MSQAPSPGSPSRNRALLCFPGPLWDGLETRFGAIAFLLALWGLRFESRDLVSRIRNSARCALWPLPSLKLPRQTIASIRPKLPHNPSGLQISYDRGDRHIRPSRRCLFGCYPFCCGDPIDRRFCGGGRQMSLSKMRPSSCCSRFQVAFPSEAVRKVPHCNFRFATRFYNIVSVKLGRLPLITSARAGCLRLAQSGSAALLASSLMAKSAERSPRFYVCEVCS